MVERKSLKRQKGIIVSDAIIAILILLLFAGIIISLITNIILESTKIKLNSQQMDFATEVLEYIEKISYTETTEDKIISYINDVKYKDSQYVKAGHTIEEITDKPYKIGVKVEKYNETEGNTDKLDFIKIVTLTIENNLGEKQYSTQISRIKKANMQEVKEMLGN